MDQIGILLAASTSSSRSVSSVGNTVAPEIEQVLPPISNTDQLIPLNENVTICATNCKSSSDAKENQKPKAARTLLPQIFIGLSKVNCTLIIFALMFQVAVFDFSSHRLPIKIY